MKKHVAQCRCCVFEQQRRSAAEKKANQAGRILTDINHEWKQVIVGLSLCNGTGLIL